MDSSELTSLDMTKIQIISDHLNKMDEKRMGSFKKSLCQLKPRRGAGRIKMGDIKDKSIEQMVEFVFRCHTDKRALATIRKALEKTNENQIKKLINRDIEIANKNNKTMETGKNEEQEQVSAMQCNVTSTLPRLPKQQFGIAASRVSTQEQQKVSTTQSNITNKILFVAPEQPFGIASSHTSSTEVSQKQSSFTNNKLQWASQEQFGVAPSKGQAQVIPIQGNTLSRASNQQFGVASSYTSSKEPPPQFNQKQSNVTVSKFCRASNETFGVAPSKEQPQVHSTQCNITKNTLSSAPSETFGTAPSQSSSKKSPPQVNLKQGNITYTPPPNTQIGVAPSHTSSKEKLPQVNLKQSNVTNRSYMASDEQFQAGPSHTSSKEQTRVNPTPDNITSNLLVWVPNTFEVAHSHVSSTEASLSEKALLHILEKRTRDIMTTHLRALGDDGIARFKDILSTIKPPFKGGKIQTREIKGKSVADMVDVIIRRHTMRRAPATVKKVLADMKENQIKMLISSDLRKLNKEGKSQ